MADDLWGDFDQLPTKQKAAPSDDVWADFDSPAKPRAVAPLGHITPTAPDPGILQRAGDAITNFITPSADHVGAIDSYTRGVMGALHRTAGTVNLLGLPAANVVDSVHALVSGQPQTGAQDAYARNMIDPEFHAAQQYDVQPHETQGFGGKVTGAMGALAPDLLAMLLTGGESAEIGAIVKPVVEQSVPRAVAQGVGQAIEHSAKASLVPGIKAGVEQAQHQDATGLPALGDVLGGYAQTTATNALPLAAGARQGAGLAEQILTKGAQGAVSMPAVSGTMATLEGQPYSLEQAGVDSVLGTVMAQMGGGEHAPLGAAVDAPHVDPVADRAARAQDALARNADVLGHGPAPDDLAQHLPPELIQQAAQVLGHPEPAQSAAALARSDGTPAAQPHPVPADAPPTPDHADPAGQTDFAQQAAAAMRMRAQAEAARAQTTLPEDSASVQPAAERAGSTPAAGDLHPAPLTPIDEAHPEGPLPAQTDRAAVGEHAYNQVARYQRELSAARSLPKGKRDAEEIRNLTARLEHWQDEASGHEQPASAPAPVTAKPARTRAVKTDTNRKPMDLLRVLAANGGLNREAFQREGVDPKELTRRAGFHYLFRKQGGMRPHDLREFMQQEGYLQPDSEHGVATTSDHDAYDLFDRAFRGGEEIYSADQSQAVAEQRERARQADHEFDAELAADPHWRTLSDADFDASQKDAVKALAERAYDLGANESDFVNAYFDATNDEHARNALQTLVAKLEQEHAARQEPASRTGPSRVEPGQEARPGFQLASPEARAESPREVAPQGGLFAPPTRGEQVRAASESKDASRNGLGRDLVRPEQGDGELLAGEKPKQAEVPAQKSDADRYTAKMSDWDSRAEKFGRDKIIEQARSAVAGNFLGRDFGESAESFYGRDPTARATRDWLRKQDGHPVETSATDNATELTDADLTPAEREVKAKASNSAAAREKAANLSRAQGEADASAKGFHDAIAKVLPEQASRVEYVRDYSGLPDELRSGVESRNAQRDGKVSTAAVYDPVSKRVFLVTSRIKSADRAAFNAAHEIAGHDGLRKLLGDQLDPALHIALQNPTVSALADAIMRDRSMDKGQRTLAAEEALAELAAAVRTGDYAHIQSRYGVEVGEGMRASVKASIANFLKRLKALLDDRFGRHVFLDEDVRALLDAAHEASKGEGKTAGDMAEQTVYHGTPHRDIEKFSLNKIGTGEGNQSFGWGMYFASDKAIAEHYRKGLSTRDFIEKARDAYDEHDSPEDAAANLREIDGLSEPQRELIDALQKDDWLGFDYPHQAIQAAMREPQNFELSPETQAAIKKQGQLYQVDVPEDHDLLDWDKPLSEQPAMVRKLRTVADEFGDVAEQLQPFELGASTGRSVYMAIERSIGNDKALSEKYEGAAGNHRATSLLLNSLGIPGLRYLDGSSRNKGEGSHNYVVWDEGAIGKPQGLLESTEPRESVAHDDETFAPHAEPPAPTVADLPSRRPGESQEAFTRRVSNTGGEELRTLQAETAKIKSIGRANFKAMLAKQARMGDVADAVFHEYRKLFDSADKTATLRSIDQWETGGTVHDPDARNFFKVMDGMFADRIERLRKAKPEALKDLVENYFPHLWEDSSKATKWYQSNTKRPLDGNKSFLKQRTWGTIREGMDSGLKPVSYNPVDLALLKLQQMDKFITFHEFKNDLKARGWLKQVKAGDKLPEGYATIDSPAFKGSHAFIVKGENGAKDEAASAHWNWAVPESIAKDVNNYLSPSLYRFKAWKSMRYVQNVLMSTRLGFSAFHAGFTTTDNLVMHVDVAGRRLLTGDIAGGLQLLVKAPLTTIISPYEGGVLNKAWRGQHVTDPQTAALLTALEEGGATRLQGSQQMDFNNALPGLIRSIRQKSVGGSLKRVLPAIGEASSYLIHQKLVPAQKMAARVMLLKFELDRLAGKLGKERGDYTGIIEAMHPDTLKQISGKVVNLVDDRLGQMNYDNQFWNKTAREVAQGLIGAVGWQVGTLRTVTGGIADLRRLWKPEALVAPLDKAGSLTGDLGRVSGRLTYLLSLGLTMGGSAALTQYLLTGQGPDELKDYFFPKTGRKNPDGSAERLQFPSYWMDHYKLATHPLQTAEHKIHPSIGMLMEAINNQDYWGVQLRDEDAPWYEQAAQIGEHIAKGFVPYSLTGQQKLADSDAGPAQRVANFVGVTTAPSTVSRSKFQAFVAEKAAASAPQGGRTQDQADHSNAMHAIEDALRRGEEPDMTGLTVKEQKAARAAAKLTVPAIRFKRLSLEDKFRAYDRATPQERHQYALAHLILDGKRGHLDEAVAKLPAEDQMAMQLRLDQLRRDPEGVDEN